MQKSFGRKKVHNNNYHHLLKRRKSSGVFLILLTIALFIFSIQYRITSLLFDEKKIDIVQHKLGDIATYLLFYDPVSSRLLARLDKIIQSTRHDQNILKTQYQEINILWDEFILHQDAFNKASKNKYKTMLEFIRDLRPFSEEILRYFGKDEEQYYLVLLQNTAEQRPNGGFFGSFAVVSLYQGKIKTFHLIDTYLPQKYLPDITVYLPERSRPLYPNPSTNWVAANKFGFHDLDGKILIELYNQTFNAPESKNIPQELCKDICNKKLSGVIFFKTDLMSTILPSFTQKQREWQFFNANIDLIRGKQLPNKKEKYFEELMLFLKGKESELIKRTLHQFETISSNNVIGLYLPDGSEKLQKLLQHYHFMTASPTPDQKTIYLRDTNTSFNKIDLFVSKSIVIKNPIGDIIIESKDNDVDVSTLQSGSYMLEINYNIHVPQHYKDYIVGLESKYNITMTDRERGILALEATDNYPDFVTRLRATRSHIYFPGSRKIHHDKIQGDSFGIVGLRTPFGQALQYKLETASNFDSKFISIPFET